jgi:hypothetical protein
MSNAHGKVWQACAAVAIGWGKMFACASCEADAERTTANREVTRVTAGSMQQREGLSG